MTRRLGSIGKSGLGLTDEEVYGQLEKPESSGSIFLWRYPGPLLMRLLEKAGILPRIRELGYPTPRLDVRVEEGLHLLKLAVDGEEAPLMDLRLSEESRVVASSISHGLGTALLSLLVVQWVSLQHVRGRFSPGRPALPGQSYPGLGLGKNLYRLLRRASSELGKDALSAYPMYYHNAVYYSRGFSYLLPERQGELLALQRDLARWPLAEASEAIQDGRLRDNSSGEGVEWKPGEMFAPVSRRVRRYFSGREYRNAVKRVASTLSFRIEPIR